MKELTAREARIVDTIHRNHRLQIQERLLPQFQPHLNSELSADKITTWLATLQDIRITTDSFLLETVKKADHGNTLSHALLEEGKDNKGGFFSRLSRHFPFNLIRFWASDKSLSEKLGIVVVENLFKSFVKQPFTTENPEQLFAKILCEKTQLSHLIKIECDRLAHEVMSLFLYREMLLLGKSTKSTLEPDVREDFIKRANLDKKDSALINAAIEAYYVQELGRIFSDSFVSLYTVHDEEIKNEEDAPIKKWLHQQFNVPQQRLAFTQQIQQSFMELTKSYVTAKMNEPSFIAKHKKFIAFGVGLIVAPLVIGALGLLAGPNIVWGASALGFSLFCLLAIGTYLLLTKLKRIGLKRKKANREGIQDSIDMINDEILTLHREMSEIKITTRKDVERTHTFKSINSNFLGPIGETKVARGSADGWLREYAARYNHSKTVQIDLGDEYRELIVQSREQTASLIDSINKKHTGPLSEWLKDSVRYLSNPRNQSVIADFDLIAKFKEQVLEIIAGTEFIPPALLDWYTKPFEQGGLAGSVSDFSHMRNLARADRSNQSKYTRLCTTATNLFQNKEPLLSNQQVFLGDGLFRKLLGLPQPGYEASAITAQTIDDYLKNSEALLFSLCKPIKPGLGLKPLKQAMLVTDEFIVYRMLLLMELSGYCAKDNYLIDAEVKLKIQHFIEEKLGLPAEQVIHDYNLQLAFYNQRSPRAQVETNSEGIELDKEGLDDVIHTLAFDLAYHSSTFNLGDCLIREMDNYLNQNKKEPGQLFAYGDNDQELLPQGTKEYVKLLKTYLHNTRGFMKLASNNLLLTSSNIYACYQHEVSIQVYKTLLRIAKLLKSISNHKPNEDEQARLDYLKDAYKRLYQFAEAYCQPLDKDSAMGTMLDFVNDLVKDKKGDMSLISQQNLLLDMMNGLPEEMLKKPAKGVALLSFFKKEMAHVKESRKATAPTATMSS